MGFLDSISDGAKSATAAITPSGMMSAAGGLNMTGLATGLLSGAAEGAMKDLLGMEDCPPGAGGGGNGMGAGNDPCGGADQALKEVALGLGMALAGPAIAAAGAAIGPMLDSGLGAVTSTLGTGIAAVSGGVGGALGLDPDSPAQSVISSSLGAGSMVALGGGSGAQVSTGLLGGAAQQLSNVNSSEKSISLFESMRGTVGA